jgi:hypothetical protein
MKRVLLKSLFVTIVVSVCFYVYSTLPNVSVLKQHNPRSSALMELRDEEYRKKAIRAPRRQNWVAYGAISENLQKTLPDQ